MGTVTIGSCNNVLDRGAILKTSKKANTRKLNVRLSGRRQAMQVKKIFQIKLELN